MISLKSRIFPWSDRASFSIFQTWLRLSRIARWQCHSQSSPFSQNFDHTARIHLQKQVTSWFNNSRKRFQRFEILNIQRREGTGKTSAPSRALSKGHANVGRVAAPAKMGLHLWSSNSAKTDLKSHISEPRFDDGWDDSLYFGAYPIPWKNVLICVGWRIAAGSKLN